jgi:glycosyltransferase involved in cell wall biosynthesis
MDKPLISLIVPCYNASSYIINCIDSISKQIFDYNLFEVIFVDDRNDKSFPIEIPNKYKLVRSHETCNNVGTFEARRVGALAATGDYIWFVDIDDKLCNIKQLPKNNEDIAVYEYYLNNNNLSLIDVKLLISRLLYPSFYFEMYEDILINEKDEKILIDIISKLDDYEIYLYNIISFFRKYYDIDDVKWLNRKQ